MTAGAVAAACEQRKHIANDPKCQELGWVLRRMATGAEKHTPSVFLCRKVRSLLIFLADLTHKIARAILSRSLPELFE